MPRSRDRAVPTQGTTRSRPGTSQTALGLLAASRIEDQPMTLWRSIVGWPRGHSATHSD